MNWICAEENSMALQPQISFLFGNLECHEAGSGLNRECTKL